MRPAALTTYACVMPWDVGPVRITRVVESVLPFAVDFFAEAIPDDVAAEGWLVPDWVDTGICTHLHFDHVGWNTRLMDGKWIPTFPHARYLFGAADIDYWSRSTDPLHSGAFLDSVQPLFDAGLVDPIAEGTAITADLTLTPGHTPGHLSVWIGDRCVITGDVLHHPIQVRHPEWTARGDVDPDLARAARSQVLETSATNNALLLGTHFAGTGAGRVFTTEDGYRFTAEVGS
jgi:glyoxylase-like metal-dependent hydrolase (beta-lactamase superfamily II)